MDKVTKFYRIGKSLFNINRSLTGKGVRDTLSIIKKYFPDLKIKKIKSGTKFYDWKTPKEWNVKKAYIIDKENKKIIDFKKNNLHLVGYSIPISKKIKKNELLKKIYSIPDQKNAIPYITSYYKDDWGFCVSENFLEKFKEKYKKNDKFKVVISSSFNNRGKLNFGEYLLKGKSKKEILISTNICHPSMANNELSGPIILMLLIDYFKNKKNFYSIRFLLIPETIGAIIFIKQNFDYLKKFLISGFVLSCIGDEKRYSCILTKYKNTMADKAIKKIVKKLNIKCKFYSFLKRGSDERQFNSPNIDLPVALISRSKFHEFKEYHTSLDDFNLVTKKGISNSFKFVKEILIYLQKREVPRVKIKCEPFMTKYNLYPTISKKNNKLLPNKIMDFIQYSDGKNDIEDISKIINLSLEETKKIYIKLIKKKIVY